MSLLKAIFCGCAGNEYVAGDNRQTGNSFARFRASS
jgi:hypothetical protein